jgi:hypothetical protein
MSHRTIENLAGAAAGIAAAVCMTLLYVAMTAPVSETVQKLLA